jgi:hypothetical protein
VVRWNIPRVNELMKLFYAARPRRRHQLPGRIDARAEIGYVFGRKVEYDLDGAEFEPEEALLMRAGFCC